MSHAAAAVHIRELAEHDELKRCVAFQKRIWGADFGEVVPPAILWVAGRTGGLVAGAFDEGGTMVGFLFGLSGFSGGLPVHWSDMLAVDPAARGRGIGTLLKRFQRDTLLARGIHEVGWTFEPLESRNAWLNFAHLGITAREYIRDCYGASDSPLHQGLGTDRLVAHWLLPSARVRMRMDGAGDAAAVAGLRAAPLVNPEDGLRLDLAAEAVRIRIPADVQALKAANAEAAVAWRLTTRRAFEAYFARGYEAVELIRDDERFSSYVLVRPGGRPGG